ncbi:MAG: hypothetical protein JSS53_02700 [Proteobacteria bacterium]|nr:hypothetical protein [Pseudomonadota bacterium]
MKNSEKSVECINELLKWVAEGHLKKVAELLQEDPKLALAKGTITDLSGRTFENITAFQLAIWYLDTEVWTVIKEHLDKINEQEALSQLNELENERDDIHKKYGKHFDFSALLSAYEAYLLSFDHPGFDHYDDCIRQEHVRLFSKEIGMQQLPVPAWYIYAFSENGEDKAWPLKDFSKTITREYTKKHIFNWFHKNVPYGLLGTDCGFFRYQKPNIGRASCLARTGNLLIIHDMFNTKYLKEVHEKQLNDLRNSLEDSAVDNNKKSPAFSMG